MRTSTVVGSSDFAGYVIIWMLKVLGLTVIVMVFEGPRYPSFVTEAVSVMLVSWFTGGVV